MCRIFYISFCRSRQFLFSRFLRFTEKKTAVRINGTDCILQIPELIKQKNISNVLFVTTAGFIKRETFKPLLAELEEAGIKAAVFSEVMPDPTIECVEKGLVLYKEAGCKAIIAAGGGSVMDCAKAIGARAVKPRKTIRQMRGMLKVAKKLPPLFAIPTTAGTGSEVTAAAVITDTINGTHYKYAVNDFKLIPEYAVLDAKLTAGLSPEMTAATGMDALTHAVEAYTNRFASRYVKKMALTSVRMIFENLPEAYKNGANLEARQNMLLASCYAGIAFTNNFVGYVHAIAHGIGGLYGVPHGKANAILLAPVMRAFGKAAFKPLSQLAEQIGIKQGSTAEKAEAFISAIENLRKETGLPAVVAELKPEDYDEIIRRAMKEANPDYPVPAIWNKDQFLSVLKAVTSK